MNKKEIGKRLKAIRKKSGLELEDAAFLINKEKRTVNSYETGERTVSLEYLLALYTHHKININYILSGEGEMFITKD